MKKTIPLLLALIIIAGVIIILTTKKSSAPQTVDPVETFAQCIKDSGSTFFGAFWCPHCNNQKALFGKKAAKMLPYQECSTADRKQNSICRRSLIILPARFFSRSATSCGLCILMFSFSRPLKFRIRRQSSAVRTESIRIHRIGFGVIFRLKTWTDCEQILKFDVQT